METSIKFQYKYKSQLTAVLPAYSIRTYIHTVYQYMKVKLYFSEYIYLLALFILLLLLHISFSFFCRWQNMANEGDRNEELLKNEINFWFFSFSVFFKCHPYI